MTNQLIKENINIDVLPTIDQNNLADKGAQLTIGDMHANFIKFLYFLVRHGILVLAKEEDYETLVKIYRTDVANLTEKHIKEFETILSEAKINKNAKGAVLRLIGDELADRGANDYFTLKLLEKLAEEGVQTRILLSNHGAEFITADEKLKKYQATKLGQGSGQARSMENMQKLIDKGLIDGTSVKEIVNNIYKKQLIALDYTLSEDGQEITIYSHAPIGLKNIENIAKELKVDYQDKTAKALAQTIENINAAFYNNYVSQNKINELFYNDSPFTHLVWNRDYDNLDRPETHHNYKVNFVHGHDSSKSKDKNAHNLDNILGKSPNHHKGEYTALYSHDVTLKPEIKEIEEKVEYNVYAKYGELLGNEFPEDLTQSIIVLPKERSYKQCVNQDNENKENKFTIDENYFKTSKNDSQEKLVSNDSNYDKWANGKGGDYKLGYYSSDLVSSLWGNNQSSSSLETQEKKKSTLKN